MYGVMFSPGCIRAALSDDPTLDMILQGALSVIRGMQRVSKPGLRTYVERQEIPRVYGGLGVAILSTSKGVRTGQQAWRLGVGGELICYVW